MLRKLSTEKNSDQTARVTITGYLVEMQVVPRDLGVEAYDVKMIDKNTGGEDLVTSTGDFDAAITIAETTLRQRAVDEQIDGFETLDSESD